MVGSVKLKADRKPENGKRGRAKGQSTQAVVRYNVVLKNKQKTTSTFVLVVVVVVAAAGGGGVVNGEIFETIGGHLELV